MPWGGLNEALDQVGGDNDANRTWLHRALLAGDVAGRWRNADGTVDAVDPANWQNEVEWENSRLVDTRYQMTILGGGARDPGPTKVTWGSVEVDLDDVARNRPAGAAP